MKAARPPFSSNFSLMGCAIVACLSYSAIGQTRFDAPAENPPTAAYVEIPIQEEGEQIIPLATPTLDWTLHKTEDGSHPNGDQQAMFWLMNRA